VNFSIADKTGSKKGFRMTGLRIRQTPPMKYPGLVAGRNAYEVGTAGFYTYLEIIFGHGCGDSAFGRGGLPARKTQAQEFGS
jgi:hypothetical protein